MRANRFLPAVSLSIALAGLTACSSGPSKPQPGTPAFSWAAAKETYTAGDYMKTLEHLDKAAKSSEYSAKATPWALIVNAALVKGYAELADDYELGARANRTNPSVFRKRTSDYRRAARPLTLQFAELIRDFEKGKDDPVVLAFPFPSGSQAMPPLFGKVTSGIVPPTAEAEDAQKQMLARAMILTTSDAVGAGEDSSKAQTLFKAGEEVKVPRATFMMAMAKALNEAADLYGPKKMDEPDHAKLFNAAAIDALKGLPETKDVKTLTEKIQKTLKPQKKST